MSQEYNEEALCYQSERVGINRPCAAGAGGAPMMDWLLIRTQAAFMVKGVPITYYTLH
jgi:hypothetical protein